MGLFLLTSACLRGFPPCSGIEQGIAMQPQVTVLLTVYNGMPYLPQAVESIFAQSFTNFTFLILNNGSSDGTTNYLDSLTDPRVHIVHLPKNIGRTAVLNKGMEQITTEFTAILDADDYAMPTRLERQMNFLQQRPEVDLVGSHVRYINQSGNTLGFDHFYTTHASIRDHLVLHNQFAHAACTFRTAAARAVGCYSPDFPYAQDFALWIAMLRNNCRVANVSEILAFIRVHPGQATRDLNLMRVRSADNARLARDIRHIPGLSSAAHQATFFREAGAEYRLGNHAKALRLAWQGLCDAPLRLLINPILWKRVSLTIQRRLHPMRP